MKKRSFKLLTYSAVASAVFSITASHASSLFLGIGLGPISESWKTDYKLSATTSAQRSVTLTTLQAHLGGDAGFRWNITPLFFTDIEAAAFYDAAGADQKHDGADFTQKAIYNYSIRLQPGMILDDNNALALVVGYDFTHFERSGNSLLALGNNFKKTVSNMELGLTTQAFLTQNLAIGTTYVYNPYKQISTNSNVSGTAETETTTYRITGDDFTLGINYYFSGVKPKPFREFISPFATSDIYLGGNVGHDVGYSNYQTNLTLPDNYDQAVNGPAFGLYFGAKKISGKAALGAEFEVKYDPDKFEIKAPNSSANEYDFSRDFQLDISGLAGIKANDSNILYARVGVAMSQLQWSGNEPDTAGTDFKKIAPGVMLGLGDEVALTRQTSLRIQYSFTRFLNIKEKNSSDEYQFAPWINNFSLGLSYYI